MTQLKLKINFTMGDRMMGFALVGLAAATSLATAGLVYVKNNSEDGRVNIRRTEFQQRSAGSPAAKSSSSGPGSDSSATTSTSS